MENDNESNSECEISYICLIYRSVGWLKFVYDQVKRHTSNLGTSRKTEFFFVANDATQEVLDYLKNNNIPHIVHTNTILQRREWYINNVYRAWNAGAMHANGKYFLFINSDMAFTDGWDKKLWEAAEKNPGICVCSRLIEKCGLPLFSVFPDHTANVDELPLEIRQKALAVMKNLVAQGKRLTAKDKQTIISMAITAEQDSKGTRLRTGQYGIEKNYGENYSDYYEKEFKEYASNISATDNELKPGGLFMPLLIRSKDFLKVGGYPEGNATAGPDIWSPTIAIQGQKCVSGDVILMKRLEANGVKQMTHFGSVVYHFQEGEKSFQ